ncbi:uncharacterized protein RJT21DRAFT_119725 [Scheffersomyces amazonensis]|uniref:uncharacterized protein n=1 Tax=Scheffersomyces amazonensis TaxID=1078765 RepID=UPI00315DF7B9
MNSIEQLQAFQNNWATQLVQCQSKTSIAMNYLDDSKLLSEKEFNITNSTIQSLLSKIQSGQLTSFEVLISFIKKSLLINGNSKVNYTNISEALLRAQYLDFYYKTYGKTLGKFHGLPIDSKQLNKFQSVIGLSDANDTTIGDNGVIIIKDLHIPLVIRSQQPNTSTYPISSNTTTCYSRSFQARLPSSIKI